MSPDGWQLLYADDFNRPYVPEWHYGDRFISQFYDHSSLFFYDPALWTSPPAPELADLRVQLRANVSLGELRVRWRESVSGSYELVLTPAGRLDLLRSGLSVAGADTPTPLSWVSLAVQMVGDSVSLSVDEMVYVTYTDPEALPSGHLSISGSMSETDDFELWTPPGIAVEQPGIAPLTITEEECTTAVGPSLSGDTMIVFSSPFSGDQAIYVMNPDGSARQILLSCPSVGLFEPRISPDGSQIAFAASGLFSNNTDLYVYRIDGDTYADGSLIRQITFDAGSDSHPTWSQDGTN